ncbi:peptidoglycan-binding domain 1 protein [Isoalcanivorax pacificus W11-5]|uniref:Peptidoglycan-binding domain 1 protein n=2 Tax=Isoalcanivorax TaxID=3020833 RepID=A0A0B4XIR7_9GAMM|nr:peptidoglycan-binding domain 1 protein [Isoalcanivorax pacificus W11-5]
MRVQIQLNAIGLYNGSIDGILGQQTQNALKLFQRIKELPESGMMTDATLQALGVSPVN